jgi:hypothetical protein
MVTLAISKKNLKAFLKYVYRLERFADDYNYDKKYDDDVREAFEELQKHVNGQQITKELDQEE